MPTDLLRKAGFRVRLTIGGRASVWYQHYPADRAGSSCAHIRCCGRFAGVAGDGPRKTRRRRGYRARYSRRRASRSCYCFFNRPRILRSTTRSLLSLCAAGLFCRACAALLLPAAIGYVLRSSAVSRAAILLRRLLNAPIRERRPWQIIPIVKQDVAIAKRVADRRYRIPTASSRPGSKRKSSNRSAKLIRRAIIQLGIRQAIVVTAIPGFRKLFSASCCTVAF